MMLLRDSMMIRAVVPFSGAYHQVTGLGGEAAHGGGTKAVTTEAIPPCGKAYAHSRCQVMRQFVRMLRLGLFALLLGCIALSATAQSVFYVRSGATGANNGSDWNNAYSSLPSTLTRGATYYLAAGSYGNYNCTTPVSGSSYITLRKATATDHGTSTGWQSSYGAGQAAFGALSFSTSYWIIDGQVRNSDWKTGYGIKFSAAGGGSVCTFTGANGLIQFVTLRYCELAGAAGSLGNETLTGAAVYCISPGNGSSHDITIQYCYTHDVWPDVFAFNAWNITIEYCFIDQNASDSNFHGQDFNGNNVSAVIMRFNKIRNPIGTAVFTIPPVGAPLVTNVWIYGNVIFDDGGASSISAFVENINDATANHWKIYNNTLSGIQWWPRVYNYSTGTDIQAYNNLWVNCADISTGNGGAAVVVDYSAYFNTPHPSDTHIQVMNANPFANASAFDFHLTGHTTPGIALPAPFNVDMDGRIRANWDRGAFEYGTSTVSTDTNPPAVAVTGPAAAAVVSNLVALSASATPDPGVSGIASVSFYVDSALIGTTTTTPYTLSWSSQAVSNGTHVLQATALDANGNQGISSNVTVTVQNPPMTLADGLTGWWSFDEGTGTVAHDRSGNMNDAALLNSAGWGTGQLNGCLSLTTANASAQIPSSQSLELPANTVSVCAWFNPSATAAYSTGEIRSIARKLLNQNNASPYSSYDLVMQDAGGGSFQPRFAVTAAGSTRVSVLGNSHPYGSWYYLAGVYDGASIHIYVNGVEEGNTPQSGALMPSAGQPLVVGDYGTETSINGLIDELRVYNRSLSPLEIQTLAKARTLPAPLGLRILTAGP